MEKKGKKPPTERQARRAARVRLLRDLEARGWADLKARQADQTRLK